MSNELDNLYREVILDHYKNPRGHGVIEDADVEAEGMNPLCGDEVSIFVSFDGDKIDDVKFRGRGCAISQAATSMLMEMVKGRTAQEVGSLDREEAAEGGGVPLPRRAARGGRDPTHTDPPQVRSARPGSAQARPAQGQGHPAAGRVG